MKMKINRIQALAAAFLILTVAMPALAEEDAATAAAGGEGEKSVNPVVLMKTTMGDLKISLYADKAPITVENFLSYVDDKFYDGTIFHRVIENFVIQGGGFTSDLVRKETKDPIQNEADNGVSNVRGTISMARLPEPHSATTQFFINVQDNSANLDHFDNGARFGYCVFGEVIEGMDVVDKMRKVQTGPKHPLPRDVPVKTIEILSVTRVETE